ncbi:MAG TPA: NAD-dependent succinate-semialdehyde dehydrogenase [Bryobacteraceae bacterium]|nr:NAD-dependent succinate-semialdehyde dehydrogenase [Bryobacteraceae bacterium]
MPIASINPTTGETEKTFQTLTAKEIEGKLELAWRAYQDQRKTSFAERAAYLRKAAQILRDEANRFGRIMTAEMGKTLKSAIAEAEKCALGCEYYAEHGATHLGEEVVPTNASRSVVRYQPIGPVLAIMPWNFPFWQVFRFAAPALMAGNVGLLKHSSNVPQCALAIEEIFCRAGFGPGVFQTLLIESSQVEGVLNDDRIAAATLTGSEPAGRSVASQAGKQIKKTVLELGGSDPFIVMPSADLKTTVAAGVGARTINNGQSCIAAKRFLVADSVYSEFEKGFVRGMEALRIGNPMQEATDIGPLATEKIREDLIGQVERARQAGATVLSGGSKPDRPGFFYQPTVLTNISRQSPIFYEELFGPVAMLFRVQNIEEAIDLANDSPFGLGSSVWTNDEAEIEQFADGIEAGQVFINAPVASDPRLPFGGVKRSGYGRELSVVGIREFVNIKTIWRK